MKTLSITLFMLVSFLATLAIDPPKPVETKLKEVTVFLSGAQLTRTGTATIPAGNSLLVFKDLPQDLNPQSIQVTGKGDFTILSVQHQINYLKEQEKTKNIVALEDSIELLSDKIKAEQAMLGVYQTEELLLTENIELGGANTGVSITALKEAADFYRLRLTDLKNKQLACSKKIYEWQMSIVRITNHLATLNTRKNIPTSEVVLMVYAAGPVSANFTLSYIVYQAGWMPFYDLRCKNTDSPVEIVYKANVYQTTGEDWENVNLTISSGNPLLSGTKPALGIWYLDYYNPYANNYGNTRGYDKKERMAEMSSVAEDGNGMISTTNIELAPAGSASSYTTQVESTTSVQFVISIPYDIPSNGQPYAVEMKKATLNAQYEYFCAPKIDKDAFLLARVTGWEDLNMLSGPMNLYFESTYVGQSNFDSKSVVDTLDLSLGRDKNIVITRERIKDFSSKKLVGLNQTESRGFEITVKNKKSTGVKLVLQDVIPVSSNKDIVVEKLEVSGATVDDTYGRLTWKMDLKPTESKKYKFAYSVKYPKDKQVILE
jgi:uncharacterized protein (TIGR02231 family)